MAKIKKENLEFSIKMEVSCVEMECFDTQKEFQKELDYYKKYLIENLKTFINDRKDYGACKTKKASVKTIKK
jgi:hypothetical protein